MEQLLGQAGPFIPLILLFVIFYFLLIRPQQKHQKKRQEMLKSLRKGDKVVTIGGIHGLIKEISDDMVVLRVADNVNIKFARAGVDRIMEDDTQQE